MEPLPIGAAPAWKSIWVAHFGRWNPQAWLSILGTSVYVVSLLWDGIPEQMRLIFSIEPIHLLWLLSWLKEYRTFEAHAASWRTDRKTFHKRIMQVMYLLLQHLDVIRLEARLTDGPALFDLGYIVIDACLCPVECDRKTWDHQAPFFSPKHGCHGLKYELAVHWRTGQIVWLAGGVPGSVHDLTLARQSGILEFLRQAGEHAFADKGYIGEDDVLLCPFKGRSAELWPDQRTWNELLNPYRTIVENSLARVTKFGILQKKYRGALSQHADIFRLCANIAQLDILDRPLRRDILEAPERHWWFADEE